MDKNNLINFFLDNTKNTDHLGVGTEHEKFIFLSKDKKRIPFKGDVSINSLFQYLITKGWLPGEISDGNIISLSRDGANITLEPGGQVELSGKIQKNIHETCAETTAHLEELNIFIKDNRINIYG